MSQPSVNISPVIYPECHHSWLLSAPDYFLNQVSSVIRLFVKSGKQIISHDWARAGQEREEQMAANVAFGGSVTAHDSNVARPTKNPLPLSSDKSANRIDILTG
jgi:hypothetical protein